MTRDVLQEKGYRLLSYYGKKYGIPQSTLASAAAREKLKAVRQSDHAMHPYWALEEHIIAWLKIYRPFVLEEQQVPCVSETEKQPELSQDAQLSVFDSAPDATADDAEPQRMPFTKILPGPDAEYDDVIDVETTTSVHQPQTIQLEWPDEETLRQLTDETTQDEQDRTTDEEVDEDLPNEPEPSVFTFHDGTQCEGILHGGLPYVELNAVCALLGINQPSHAADRLRREGFEVLAFVTPSCCAGTSGALRRKNYIGVDGAMFVAGSSNKPKAREATRWLYSTVLISIVRKGYYAAAGAEKFPDMKILDARIKAGELALKIADGNRVRLARLELEQAKRDAALHSLNILTTHVVGEVADLTTEQDKLRAVQGLLENKTRDLETKTHDNKERLRTLEQRDAVRQWKTTLTMACDDHETWLRAFNKLVKGCAVAFHLEKDNKFLELRALRDHYPAGSEEHCRITKDMRRLQKKHYESTYRSFYDKLRTVCGIDLRARQRYRERKTGKRPTMCDLIEVKERYTVLRLLLLLFAQAKPPFEPDWLREQPLWRAFWALNELQKGRDIADVIRRYATYN